MKLYGSLTSPFVRRVRFIATELKLNFTLVDTLTEAGQAEMRTKNPLWKVPYLEFDDGMKLWDSHVIISYMFENFGTGSLRIPSGKEKWRESNIIHAIDTAVESAINVFYLKNDGLKADDIPYLVKQSNRVTSILNWIQTELNGIYFSKEEKLGLSELNLLTILDWLRFRNAYPVMDNPLWVEILNKHYGNENLVFTRPPS